MPAGTIAVFLIGAVGIKDTELFELIKKGGAMVENSISKYLKFGKADPYALLVCGKQKLRSNTASNQGSKPIWNQNFSFYIDDTVNELKITLYNRNILTEDDEIGTTRIPLAKVFAEGKLATTSYNVVRPSGRVQGEVKLSLSFTPKVKGGQQTPPSNIPGPYGTKLHGSPYASTPPEPNVKHDPLTGPYGYFKNNSSASNSSSVSSSSHGGMPFSPSAVGPYSSDSSHGSRPYPSSATDTYPPRHYPPANEPQPPYYHNESNAPSYHHSDSLSPSSRPSHPALYPAPSTSYPQGPPTDYDGSVYQHSPYGHGPHPSAIPHPSEANLPGNFPRPSAPPTYPPLGGQNSPYSVPSVKPSHGAVDQYRFEELAGNFGGLKVSGDANDSSSHGTYPGYHRHQNSIGERPTSGYPHSDSLSHGNYPGPNDRPTSGYPPPGYAAPGYPPHCDGNHGSFSQHYGPPQPPPSYYPHMGNPGQGPPAGYPPAPYYNAPPPNYIPAGYPK